MCDADAKFAKEVSSSPRKGKMQMQLYMTERLKSICKFKEEQVADYFGLKKSICNSEHQGSADTLGATRASAIVNIKAVQIHRLSKKHLRQQITRWCRYTTKQEKTMQSSELESGLPDEAEQDCIVFSCLEAVVN